MGRIVRRRSGRSAVIGPPERGYPAGVPVEGIERFGVTWMDSDLPDATKLHDVFICHASEDKDEFVRPLAEMLRSHHLAVWYDEFVLEVGDSLREAIDRGLATSRYGVVVLSPSFFRKRWPKRELNGLVAREMGEDRGMILPIWHHVDRDQVLAFSSPLADLRAAVSAAGLSSVVGELLKKLRPEVSPVGGCAGHPHRERTVATDRHGRVVAGYYRNQGSRAALSGPEPRVALDFSASVSVRLAGRGTRSEYRVDSTPARLGARWKGPEEFAN